MSKKKRKNPFTRTDRGPTFVGLAPKVEDGKEEKIRKAEKKHRNKFEEY